MRATPMMALVSAFFVSDPRFSFDRVLVLRLPCQIEILGRTTWPLRVALSKVDKGFRVLPVEGEAPSVESCGLGSVLSFATRMMRSAYVHKIKTRKHRNRNCDWCRLYIIHHPNSGLQIALSIERAKEIDVPWTLDLLLRFRRFIFFSYVDEVVRVVAEDLADGEWALPWR